MLPDSTNDSINVARTYRLHAWLTHEARDNNTAYGLSLNLPMHLEHIEIYCNEIFPYFI